MKHPIHSLAASIGLGVLLLSSPAHALPGDILVIATASVVDVGSTSQTPPLPGMQAGAIVQVIADVFDQPQVLPDGSVAYAMDVATSGLLLDGVLYPPSSPGSVVVSSGFPADSITLQFNADTPSFFTVSAGLVGAPADLFPTTDLSQLGGTYGATQAITSIGLLGNLSGVGGVLWLANLQLSSLEISAGGQQCDPVGVPYCGTSANSSGVPAILTACGSPRVADNLLTLVTSDMPEESWCYPLAARGSGFIVEPAGAAGNLCLSGTISRFIGLTEVPITGRTTYRVDLIQIPGPLQLSTVLPGETWYFQVWYQDLGGPLARSNFTNGLEIQFL